MNYEFKGTPGPWNVSYTNVDMETVSPFDETLTDVHCSATISGAQDLALGSTLGINTNVGNFWVKKDVAIPNAYLISASPDLLQVAINAINDLRNLVPQSEARDNRIEQIEVIIRKALNQQP